MITWNVRLATLEDAEGIAHCYNDSLYAGHYPKNIHVPWTLVDVTKYFRWAPYVWVGIDTADSRIKAFAGFASLARNKHDDPTIYPCDEAVIGTDRSLEAFDRYEGSSRCFGQQAKWLLENSPIKYLQRAEQVQEGCKPTLLMDSWKIVVETYGPSDAPTVCLVRYDIQQCYDTLLARGWV